MASAPPLRPGARYPGIAAANRDIAPAPPPRPDACSVGAGPHSPACGSAAGRKASGAKRIREGIGAREAFLSYSYERIIKRG